MPTAGIPSQADLQDRSWSLLAARLKCQSVLLCARVKTLACRFDSAGASCACVRHSPAVRRRTMLVHPRRQEGPPPESPIVCREIPRAPIIAALPRSSNCQFRCAWCTADRRKLDRPRIAQRVHLRRQAATRLCASGRRLHFDFGVNRSVAPIINGLAIR